MHCNLRQPDAAQSLPALILSPVPSSKLLSLSVAVLQRFNAYTLRYAVTLNDPVTLTLTFDIEHVQCASCATVKLCTKFELDREIRGGVIAV